MCLNVVMWLITSVSFASVLVVYLYPSLILNGSYCVLCV